MLKIVTVPNKILETAAHPVEEFGQSLLTFIASMEKALITQSNPQGVGLAANQVGDNRAIFIMKPTPKAKTEVIINPKIVKTEGEPVKYKNRSKAARSKGRESSLEGCLSIPRIWSSINRANRVSLEYQDASGKKHKRWFSGFKAVIVQHEVDHLSGILFTQRALEQNQEVYEEVGDKLVKLEH